MTYCVVHLVTFRVASIWCLIWWQPFPTLQMLFCFQQWIHLNWKHILLGDSKKRKGIDSIKKVIIRNKHMHCFFAIKLNCQYSYLDKLQNSIPFLLLFFSSPPCPTPSSFYLCIYLHHFKARYGLKDVVVGEAWKRQTKAYWFSLFVNMKEYIYWWACTCIWINM